jgi:hypothetical protein
MTHYDVIIQLSNEDAYEIFSFLIAHDRFETLARVAEGMTGGVDESVELIIETARKMAKIKQSKT